MSEVIGLDRKPVEVCGALPPAADIVTRCRELLAQAERGEIRAMAVAIVRPNHETTTMYEVPQAEPIAHELMAAITYLMHRYAGHKLG